MLRYCRLMMIPLLTGCCLTAGCWDRPSSKTATNTTPAETTTEETTTTAKTPEVLKHPANLTPRQLLEKTVTAYKSATSYSDHGEARIIGKMTDPNAEPAPWFCTVAYQTPGKLRLEISEGKFISDGEDCFAQIRPIPDQVLRFPTPKRWTLDVLFQDLFLDQAMDVGLPDTILRFPPQLILLFAKDPLKTLLPEGSESEILDPQWLGKTPCDVIRVVHPQGNRLLWISRTNNALLRFDYYVENLPVPPGFESIRLIQIDLSDAQFNQDIFPEAFQMQQPKEAKTVSEFQPGEMALQAENPAEKPVEKTVENPLALLSKMRDEHRKEIQTMLETDYFATIPPASETPVKKPAQTNQPLLPKVLSFKEVWKQPLTGSGNIIPITVDSGTDSGKVGSGIRLLIPCEGNSLAMFDLTGKLLQKIKPEGLLNDELLTLVRTGTDGAGKRYIGVSSANGRAVHVLDDSFKLIFSYQPTPIPTLTPEMDKANKTASEAPEPKQVVTDFQFVDLQGDGSLAIFLGMMTLDDGKDSIRAIDLQGNEMWRNDSVSSPFQVDSFVFDGKRQMISIDVQEQRSQFAVFDLQGKRLEPPKLEDGRQILWFDVMDIDGDGQSEIAVLHSDAGEKNVQFAILERGGKPIWSRNLPSGDYHKSIEQIVMGDLCGDANKEWIVPTPNGTVFVFDQSGNELDSFSFGKPLTGLTVITDNGKRLLLVADAESLCELKIGD